MSDESLPWVQVYSMPIRALPMLANASALRLHADTAAHRRLGLSLRARPAKERLDLA